MINKTKNDDKVSDINDISLVKIQFLLSMKYQYFCTKKVKKRKLPFFLSPTQPRLQKNWQKTNNHAKINHLLCSFLI